MSTLEHLLLLIGPNPLPPYIAATYLLEEQELFPRIKHLWLLYSEAGPQQQSTLASAQRLQATLQTRFEVDVSLYPIRDVSSAPAIHADVVTLAEQLQGQSCHLNYAGGTKAMAVHSYRSLEQALGEQISFSYLDGRRFQMISDQTGQALHDAGLRSLVQVSLDELLALQGFDSYAPYQRALDPAFGPALDAFDALLSADLLPAYWGELPEESGWAQLRAPLMQATSGVHQVERDKYLRMFGRQIAKSWPQHRANWESLTLSAALHSVLDAFPDPYQGLLAQPSLPENLRELYHLIRFLDGIWLEMHTFRAVSAALNTLELHADLGMGLQLRQPGWQTYFELDLAAMIGHQLLGVSCTSYNAKAPCKNKGFEIIHRVRQLGGDEVRESLKMMLVTCVNALNRDRLQQELALSTGAGTGNILVCGLADLPLATLTERVRGFLSSAQPPQTA